MIHDKIPDLTEEFTLTIIRADGSKSEQIYKDERLLLTYLTLSSKVDRLAKEISNHGRKSNDQT